MNGAARGARRLLHFPIIHGEEDLGGLADEAARQRPGGMQHRARHRQTLAQFWDAVEKAIATLRLNPTRVRIYQDGLPVCGYEERIVADLAANGSRNHRLIQQLTAQGAHLVGSESPQLLVEEYELMKQRLGGNGSGTADNRLAADLLTRRDEFIARRINETLQAGETGLLFLGLMHQVAGALDKDIVVTHPIGLPAMRALQ